MCTSLSLSISIDRLLYSFSPWFNHFHCKNLISLHLQRRLFGVYNIDCLSLTHSTINLFMHSTMVSNGIIYSLLKVHLRAKQGEQTTKSRHTHMQPANERTIEQTIHMCIGGVVTVRVSFERIHKIDDVLSVQLIIKVCISILGARARHTPIVECESFIAPKVQSIFFRAIVCVWALCTFNEYFHVHQHFIHSLIFSVFLLLFPFDILFIQFYRSFIHHMLFFSFCAQRSFSRRLHIFSINMGVMNSISMNNPEFKIEMK